MKTEFIKIDERWVAPTGKIVVVEYINFGDYFDEVLSDQYIDVCNGQTFALSFDDMMSELTGEKVYHLVKHYEVVNTTKRRKKKKEYIELDDLPF